MRHTAKKRRRERGTAIKSKQKNEVNRHSREKHREELAAQILKLEQAPYRTHLRYIAGNRNNSKKAKQNRIAHVTTV